MSSSDRFDSYPDDEDLTNSCPMCGEPIAEYSSRCGACGEEFGRVSPEQLDYFNVPSGIGGWLILPAIGLILSPILSLVFVLANCEQITNPEKAIRADGVLITPKKIEEQYPGYLNVVKFEIASNCVFIVVYFLSACIFFQKKKIVPRIMIFLYSIGVIWALIDFLLASSVFGNLVGFGDVVKGCIGAAIWIPYFCISKRVKATFVN